MKKILAMMLTAAMMLSMGTAVFAEKTGTPENNYDNKLDVNAIINKDYHIKNGTNPEETFTFNFEFMKYEDRDGVVYTANENDKTVASYTDNKGTDDDTTDDVTVTVSNIPEILATNSTVYAATAYDTTAANYDETLDANVVEGTVTVNLNAASFPAIGIYTYAVTETDSNTEGVTYTKTPLYLVITILRKEDSTNHFVAAVHYQTEDGTKTGEVINTYEAGSLEITKQITGNMADMQKEFEFTVSFEATGDDVLRSAIATNAAESGITYTVNEDGSYTFNLGDNDTAIFSNLPVGTKYTVYEDADGYDQTSVTGAEAQETVQGTGIVVTGTISANKEVDKVEYTNDLSEGVDTGISVDSIPYIAMLGVVAVGGAGFMVSKKRRSED